MSKTPRSDPDALSLKPGKGAAARTPAKPASTKPDFSGVRGRADTVPGETGDSTRGAGDVTPTASRQSYTVKKGDTLSHIAQRFYGKAGQWSRIYEANRDQLDDPDLILPGQTLKIPPAERDH